MFGRIACLAGSMLFLGAAAPAGEEAKPGPFAGGDWAGAQRGAAKAHTVVVARVLEAGPAKGKGWNMQARGDNLMAPVDIRQEATVEVTEVVRGGPEPGRIAVNLQTVQYQLQSLYQMTMVFNGKRATRRQSVPAGDFALVKDRSYLLFLSEPKTLEGRDEGARLAAEHLAEINPMEDPDARLLASVRGFCRALAAWKDPPKLSPKEDARIKGLVADLGAEDFEKREQAEGDLRKFGAGARLYIEAALEDKNAERSFRAGFILKAVEPVPGEVEIPSGGPSGNDARSGTMKERPKDKPKIEPEPEQEIEEDPAPVPAPAPVPEPEPLPELPAADD